MLNVQKQEFHPLVSPARQLPPSDSEAVLRVQAEAAIEAVVARFYERLLPQPRMGDLFFANTPMER